jgi:hypothetical protein
VTNVVAPTRKSASRLMETRPSGRLRIKEINMKACICVKILEIFPGELLHHRLDNAHHQSSSISELRSLPSFCQYAISTRKFDFLKRHAEVILFLAFHTARGLAFLHRVSSSPCKNDICAVSFGFLIYSMIGEDTK